MPEIYISTDVETDGLILSINSMLSFGSAAYLPDKTLVRAYKSIVIIHNYLCMRSRSNRKVI